MHATYAMSILFTVIVICYAAAVAKGQKPIAPAADDGTVKVKSLIPSNLRFTLDKLIKTDRSHSLYFHRRRLPGMSYVDYTETTNANPHPSKHMAATSTITWSKFQPGKPTFKPKSVTNWRITTQSNPNAYIADRATVQREAGAEHPGTSGKTAAGDNISQSSPMTQEISLPLSTPDGTIYTFADIRRKFPNLALQFQNLELFPNPVEPDESFFRELELLSIPYPESALVDDAEETTSPTNSEDIVHISHEVFIVPQESPLQSSDEKVNPVDQFTPQPLAQSQEEISAIIPEGDSLQPGIKDVFSITTDLESNSVEDVLGITTGEDSLEPRSVEGPGDSNNKEQEGSSSSKDVENGSGITPEEDNLAAGSVSDVFNIIDTEDTASIEDLLKTIPENDSRSTDSVIISTHSPEAGKPFVKDTFIPEPLEYIGSLQPAVQVNYRRVVAPPGPTPSTFLQASRPRPTYSANQKLQTKSYGYQKPVGPIYQAYLSAKHIALTYKDMRLLYRLQKLFGKLWCRNPTLVSTYFPQATEFMKRFC